jgi:hypothetical protein
MQSHSVSPPPPPPPPPCVHYIFSPIRFTCPLHHIFLNSIKPNNILRCVHIIKLIVIQFSPIS